jgi:hypothetical protein
MSGCEGMIVFLTAVGPCALDYSKTKTQDHFWTDPPADELVQRHRISSGHATPPSCRRPALNVSVLEISTAACPVSEIAYNEVSEIIIFFGST